MDSHVFSRNVLCCIEVYDWISSGGGDLLANCLPFFFPRYFLLVLDHCADKVVDISPSLGEDIVGVELQNTQYKCPGLRLERSLGYCDAESLDYTW